MLIALILFGCPDEETDTSVEIVDTDDTDTDTDTDDTDTDTDAGTELTGDATIWAVCGPSDGAAVSLSVAQLDAECAIDGSDPRNAHPVSFFLFNGLPGALPATLVIAADTSADGTASYSPTPSGPTYQAVSGSVTFTAYTDRTHAQGTWTLTLADASVIHGDFDAPWCANEPVCR